MDPNRPRTPEELAIEAEASRQTGERPAVEAKTAPPSEAAAGTVNAEPAADDRPSPVVGATTGALDPADLSDSLDVGAQATPDDVPDSSVERHSLEIVVDKALARADSRALDAGFSPFDLDEIVASLPAASIADVPAATLAKDMVATWQDVPEDFASGRDDTTDHRGTDGSDLPPIESRDHADAMSVDDIVPSDSIEPPSGSNADFRDFDRGPELNPTYQRGISDLLARPNDPIVIERGPLRTDDESWRPSIELLSATGDKSNVPERPPAADLSPRATMLQTPTSGGGPPLARPIFLVSVPDEQTRRILDEALAEAGRRDAKTAAEIAQQQVDDAFWLRACEERALFRGR